jgi:hypothetical protein
MSAARQISLGLSGNSHVELGALRSLFRLGQGADLIPCHPQPDAVGQLLECIGVDRYHSVAETEEATHLHLDRVDFSVRASGDIDHLAEVFLVGAVNGHAHQGRQTL